MKLSLKSQLLLEFKDHEQMWEQDAVKELMDKEHITSDYWKWTLRYYLLEMAANGMFTVVRYEMDDGTYFEAGHSLAEYRITEFGNEKIATMLE